MASARCLSRQVQNDPPTAERAAQVAAEPMGALDRYDTTKSWRGGLCIAFNPFASLAFYRRVSPSPSTAATCSRFLGKLPIAMVSMAGRDIPADFPLAGTPKYPPWTHRYSRFWRPNSADFTAPLPARAAAVKSHRQACCAFPQSTRVIGGCISAPGPVYRARVRAELYPRAPQLKETADVGGCQRTPEYHI